MLTGILQTEVGIPFSNFKSRSWCFFTKSWFINTSVPLLISTFVVMIFFPSIILISTCINFKLVSKFGTLLILTPLMESPLEDLDIEASLHIKNPVLQLIPLDHYAGILS